MPKGSVGFTYNPSGKPKAHLLVEWQEVFGCPLKLEAGAAVDENGKPSCSLKASNEFHQGAEIQVEEKVKVNLRPRADSTLELSANDCSLIYAPNESANIVLSHVRGNGLSYDIHLKHQVPLYSFKDSIFSFLTLETRQKMKSFDTNVKAEVHVGDGPLKFLQGVAVGSDFSGVFTGLGMYLSDKLCGGCVIEYNTQKEHSYKLYIESIPLKSHE